MGLQYFRNLTTKGRSQMTKKLLGMVAVAVFCSALAGCTSTQSSVQGYSIRSYQGPLPMEDLRFVNAEAYGVPVNPR
jgi:hypothetical protein